MRSSRKNFQQILDDHRGIGPGFDILRLLLAIILFIYHAKGISDASTVGALLAQNYGALDGSNEQASQATNHFGALVRPFKLSLVPAFFALSGFLVLGSALRLRATSTFLAYRALRIFPALFVEVSLSALILGPALTTFALHEYFSDYQFFRYFGNIAGEVTFFLPGVFEHNPMPGIVNKNLWTLPAEFFCYLITAILLLSRIIYHRLAFTLGMALATIGLAIAHYYTGMSNTIGPYPPVVIVYYFFIGALFYHYRDYVCMHWLLFILAGMISYGCMLDNSLVYIAPIPLTYCVLCFGMTNFGKIPFISRGDYSYGIYLYGFPISQAYMAIFPNLKGHFLLLVLLAGITTIIFAVFSWHGIEKHMLTLKRKLPIRWFPHQQPVRYSYLKK